MIGTLKTITVYSRQGHCLERLLGAFKREMISTEQRFRSDIEET